jgi:hypothetical protein
MVSDMVYDVYVGMLRVGCLAALDTYSSYTCYIVQKHSVRLPPTSVPIYINAKVIRQYYMCITAVDLPVVEEQVFICLVSLLVLCIFSDKLAGQMRRLSERLSRPNM